MKFEQWLASAKRGDRFRYYRGFMLADADPLSGSPKTSLLVAKIRYQAQQAMAKGWVTLVQERHGAGDYVYLAVRL